MNPIALSPAAEINRLHAAAQRQAAESRQSLHEAVASAWHAGRLLRAEKMRVRRTVGAGAWLHWLERNFDGARRTAQNYMRLSRHVADITCLEGLSLRQTYLRLGIATEPKSRAESPHVGSLPKHVRLASRLLVALKAEGDFRRLPPERLAAYREDCRAVYEWLGFLYGRPAQVFRSRRSRRPDSPYANA